jgi:hypothetical protein
MVTGNLEILPYLGLNLHKNSIILQEKHAFRSEISRHTKSINGTRVSQKLNQDYISKCSKFDFDEPYFNEYRTA